MRRPVAEWLPGPAEWHVDGALNGHTPAETVAWASLSMDLADERADRAGRRSVIVSPDLPRRWRRRSRV